MPIGVPRIICCWGEELPTQWTDIYNFIFRRRMIFLMQYLDDELCNQICGLLINIHMEDRAKELEKKEMENSGIFKSSNKQQKTLNPTDINKSSTNLEKKSWNSFSKEKLFEDLLISESDLEIDENYELEQYTLQKMTLEWLNWNSQFFDYSEEPYLFYLAEILSKNFTKDESHFFYNNQTSDLEFSKFLMMFKNMTISLEKFDAKTFDLDLKNLDHLDIYYPFRRLSHFLFPKYDSIEYFQLKIDNDNKNQNSLNLLNRFKEYHHKKQNSNEVSISYNDESNNYNNLLKNENKDVFLNQQILNPILFDFTEKDFLKKTTKKKSQFDFSKKILTQRKLNQNFKKNKIKTINSFKTKKVFPSNYLNENFSDDNNIEYREYYRKKTEKTIQEEESKKVFMIINSFGGSVGNGITIHDALQFIKAGSLTLALGVAASAASLALAGGTIGERYVTEACHVMIHQPEGGLNGQASDIWIDSQEIMKIRLDVAEIYSLSTYRPRHKILRDLDRDFYLTAMETIFYGLADEIATNDVMHEIIEMTNKVWDYHDAKQQKLLENRSSQDNQIETETEG
nr:proteolytic subunit 2 of clp protease [Elakatothrix viridis]